MENFAIETLWWTSFALPALLFLTLNPFKNAWLTWLRAMVSIACGWAAMFSYALAANAINYSMVKTDADFAELANGDGAKLATAAVLGWVVPAVIVFGIWGVRLWLRRNRNQAKSSP